MYLPPKEMVSWSAGLRWVLGYSLVDLSMSLLLGGCKGLVV